MNGYDGSSSPTVGRAAEPRFQEYVGELSATIESHLLLIPPKCILFLGRPEWLESAVDPKRPEEGQLEEVPGNRT